MFNIKETLKNNRLNEIIYTESILENNSMIGLLKWIDEVIPNSLRHIDSDHTGLYFASSDAGAITSVEFWKEAVEKNISFANPRNFPATLSNFVAASFATKMQIRGPNINLIGDIETLPQLFFHAIVDMKKNRIDRAIVAFVPSFLNKEQKSLGVLWIEINLTERILDGKDRDK